MTLRPIGGDDEAPAGFEPASTWVAMPIRPGSPLHGETRLERIEAGESLEIRAGDALEEGTCITRVRVSSRPEVHLLPALRKLLDYPHGCVEQTTSGLLGLIYAPDLLGQAGGDADQYQRISEMVRGGIARLWSMQTADGGLAYWPGGTTSSPWGTAYAAGVLAEAARAGYKVDEQFIDPLAGYLRRRLESSNRAGESLNTKALICRVLATLDEADPGWLALLAEQADKLDIAGRADLAAAYLASGRRDKALELMDADLLTAEVPLSMEGRLTSQTTQEARLLSVLLELEPKHAWIGVLMRRLDEARRESGAWGSTINNASVIAALSKAVVLQDGPVSFRGRIQAGEKTVEFTEASPAGGTFEDASVRVTTQGEGQLYVTVMREGLARPGVVEPYDRGLVVRREWLDAQGEPIDPARLQVGDRMEVRIHLRSRGGRQVPNVAIVDALPACVEVEAPWLTRLDENGQGAPDRTEFLDDRVVLFATAGQEKVFRYHLRVTTAGSFLLPGLQGSAMYNPEVASLTEATRLEVAR
jgi:uncharacterized protein YfaS (alpha-2-macroglobulin family)